MDAKVDKFLKKSKNWQGEIAKLRSVILQTKLEEDFKWNLPCYTHKESNVVIIQPFKKCLGLMFFKGGLLKDPKKVLVANGPNSQATKRLEFRSVEEIIKKALTIKAYIKEAIALEDSGKKVEFKKELKLPEELKAMFSKQPAFKKAFSALTPGRQRAYVIHFAGAKQAATRISRIEKHLPRILKGKGMMD